MRNQRRVHQPLTLIIGDDANTMPLFGEPACSAEQQRGFAGAEKPAYEDDARMGRHAARC
jgi:hypothetical protein